MDPEPEITAQNRPEPLGSHNKRSNVSSEMIAPASPPPSRFKSKWWGIFSEENEDIKKGPE